MNFKLPKLSIPSIINPPIEGTVRVYKSCPVGHNVIQVDTTVSANNFVNLQIWFIY